MMHIIDDSETVLGVMSELVESFGYHVRTFTSSRDYLRYACSGEYREPKAVFADMMMPDMDGFSLMRRVCAMHPEVRFVVMSDQNFSGQQDTHGACIYLRKPIRFDKLEAAFEHLRQCLQCRPAEELSVSLNDDRRHFGIEDTRCPRKAGKEDG